MTNLKINRGYALWMFGPPAAGKTTISSAVQNHLESFNIPVILFDGDITRKIVSDGIGHTEEDRILLTHRYAALSAYLVKSKVIVILAAINHTNKQRHFAREKHPKDQFGLVWIQTPLNVCKKRDPKGLYAKAEQILAAGDKANVVGVDLPFEEPDNYDLALNTSILSPSEAGPLVKEFLISSGAISF